MQAEGRSWLVAAFAAFAAFIVMFPGSAQAQQRDIAETSDVLRALGTGPFAASRIEAYSEEYLATAADLLIEAGDIREEDRDEFLVAARIQGAAADPAVIYVGPYETFASMVGRNAAGEAIVLGRGDMDVILDMTSNVVFGRTGVAVYPAETFTFQGSDGRRVVVIVPLECWNFSVVPEAPEPANPCLEVRVTGFPSAHHGARVLAADIRMGPDGTPLSDEEDGVIRACINMNIAQPTVDTENICFDLVCDYGVTFDGLLRPTLASQGIRSGDYEEASSHGNVQLEATAGLREVRFFIPGMTEGVDGLHFPGTCILIVASIDGAYRVFVSSEVAEEGVALLKDAMAGSGQTTFDLVDDGIAFYTVEGKTDEGVLLRGERPHVIDPSTGEMVRARFDESQEKFVPRG